MIVGGRWFGVLVLLALGVSCANPATPSPLREGQHTLVLELRQEGHPEGRRRELEVTLERRLDRIVVRDAHSGEPHFTARLEGTSFTAVNDLPEGEDLVLEGTLADSGIVAGTLRASHGTSRVAGDFVLTPGRPRRSTGPVTLLPMFSTPLAERPEFEARWRAMRDHLAQQPGFIDMELLGNVSSVGPYTQVGRIVWATEVSLRSALESPEFRRLAEDLEGRMTAALFERVE